MFNQQQQNTIMTFFEFNWETFFFKKNLIGKPNI